MIASLISDSGVFWRLWSTLKASAGRQARGPALRSAHNSMTRKALLLLRNAP